MWQVSTSTAISGAASKLNYAMRDSKHTHTIGKLKWNTKTCSNNPSKIGKEEQWYEKQREQPENNKTT